MSDAEIAKSVSSTLAKNDDLLTYTLTVRAVGGMVHNVVVTDVLPAHLNFVSFGPVPTDAATSWDSESRTMTWNLPDMTAGKTYLLTYQAQVDSYVLQGTALTNNAQLAYAELTGTKSASAEVRMATLYTVSVAVYNAAGELVKEIWVQKLSEQIMNITIPDAPSILSLRGIVYVVSKGVTIAAWDGTNGDGNPVSNGAYYLKVGNMDAYGVVTSVSDVVTVSRAIAKAEVDIFNEAGEVVRHLYGYADDPGLSSVLTMQLSTSAIKPGYVASGATPSQVAVMLSNGVTVVWDGKSDGGIFVQSGQYFIVAHTVDGQGREATETQQISVLDENSHSGVGKVTAIPNLMNSANGYQAVFKSDSSISFTLRVSVYTVAGELVGVFQGEAGINQVKWDASGVASGLYLAVVEEINAQGGLASRQIVKIVVVH